MFRRVRSSIRTILLVSATLLVIGVLAAAVFIVLGGDTRAVRDTLSEAQEWPEGLWDRAKEWGEQQIAEPANDSSEPEPERAKRTEHPAEEPPAPLTVTTNESVSVFFAPCRKRDADGIDDHLLALVERAETSILCAFYELQLPEIAKVLIDKHHEGVAVRIVSDTEYADRRAMERCIAAGIPVVFDERSAFMHNKFCVVDGRYVWTGSTNITERGFYDNNNNAVLIDSEWAARNYALEFREMFVHQQFGPRSPSNTSRETYRIENVMLEILFSPEDDVLDALIEEIDDAETSIDFMAFAFTSEDIAKAMVARMKDGVRVRGLFEKRSAGSKYSRDEFLAERGAEIHLDANRNTMHHKVIIIDSETVITGSYNFSKSAEKSNDENVIILHSPAIAGRYTQEFEGLVAK